jgi:rhodanese-related sulfurtransferase
VEGTIIDVRELPEFAAGHIEGATLVPLAKLARSSQEWEKSNPLTLVCKSGRRAEQARQNLERLGFTALHVLPGGMDAWSAAGKPVVKETRQLWAMERQVRIVAVALFVATVVLGFTMSRYFLIGTALVGAGLMFAGVRNTRRTASLVGRVPRNKVGA